MNDKNITAMKRRQPIFLSFLFLSLTGLGWLPFTSSFADAAAETEVRQFVETHCLGCHDSAQSEGGLDLSSLSFDLTDAPNFATWLRVHDRVRDGEMPPEGELDSSEAKPFLEELSGPLVDADRKRTAGSGRATTRRLNRYEYENSLRELLRSPHLMVAQRLPADAMSRGYSKSGNALSVSHVQMEKFLELGELAIRTAVDAAAHPSQKRRYYARQEDLLLRYLVAPPVRATVPLIDGWTVQKDVVLGKQPKTASGQPDIQEREAMAVFVGSRNDATRVDFTKMNPPITGRYNVRVKSYTLQAGANGYGGGKGFEDSGRQEVYFPDKRDVRKTQRSEPVTVYAMKESGDSRWLDAFDSLPDPAVIERSVILEQGDDIRLDASRLVRYEADWAGNPNQTEDAIPGCAVQWVEVEGPIVDAWPPPSYAAVFGKLPFDVDDGHVKAIPTDARDDARRLLCSLATRAYRGRLVPDEAIDAFVNIYDEASRLGYDFTDAMIKAASAVLTSPDFLYLQSEPEKLDAVALSSRLSYFLWNGPPDEELLQAVTTRRASEALDDADRSLTRRVTDLETVLQQQTYRLLDDPRSDRFVEHFLDQWLELQEISTTVADEGLYPEYDTDTLLVESALRETRLFFATLIGENLPARNLIDSDFVFANERLAEHYGLPTTQTAELQRIQLPDDSPRGGLMTQAAVLKVTANGTTTSPVLRGKWIVERLLGIEIPPPPSGVEAIEPDIRGAVTIRQQLSKHVEAESCMVCQLKAPGT